MKHIILYIHQPAGKIIEAMPANTLRIAFFDNTLYLESEGYRKQFNLQKLSGQEFALIDRMLSEGFKNSNINRIRLYINETGHLYNWE